LTTIIPFVPSNISAPEYLVRLDGTNYKLIVTWNVSASRYYINIYTTDGQWVLTTALVSSPPARPVQNITFDPFLNIMRVQMADPSQWPVPLAKGGALTKPGTIVDYTLMGFSPNNYNGRFRSLQINQTTFTFSMNVHPPPLVVKGTVHRLLNMIGTVFKTSTLVYRNAAFEVNP
jgi:hypothetical protein